MQVLDLGGSYSGSLLRYGLNYGLKSFSEQALKVQLNFLTIWRLLETELERFRDADMTANFAVLQQPKTRMNGVLENLQFITL